VITEADAEYGSRAVDNGRSEPIAAALPTPTESARLFIARLAGVSLGIARAALDAAEVLLAGRLLVPEMRPVSTPAEC
jgi:hypothetical protein